jgi:cytochrome c-type biogenesis protein CcmF
MGLDAALGRSGVLLGFLAAAAGVATLAVGLARGRPELLRTGRRYAFLLLAGALAATAAMQHALVTHDFSLAYVAQNNSRETPLLFSITGMWSALAGSILLWGLVLSVLITVMVHRFRRRAGDPLVGWATLATYGVAAFFFGLMAGPANPFSTVSGPVPPNGAGPNVLLQDNVLVAIHPVFLYLGFVGFTVPFAFAVASLATGRFPEGWTAETRRFALLSWTFLSVGIVLGAWWSYQVLGWGGFWAWDPVENAALLPWLCATAYLHSALAEQRRGMLRVWNLSLLLATFSLTIFGTFLTRSGVVESVHSFSNSDLGPVLLGFFALVVVVGIGLIVWRADRLRAGGSLDSALSREGSFLVNNLLLGAFAFVVLLGTVFPLIVQAFGHPQVTVGQPYFDTMVTPLALALLFFMAVGPVLPWRRASPSSTADRLQLPAWAATLALVSCVAAGVRGPLVLLAYGLGAFAGTSALRAIAASFWTARARVGTPQALLSPHVGGMVVHLGVVIIAVALATSLSFGHRGQLTLAPGQSGRFAGHTITYLGDRTVTSPSHTALEADVVVDGGSRVLHPAVSQYGSNADAVGTPAISSTLRDDVYLTLDGPPQGKRRAVVLGVIVQPLVIWLWIGGAVIAAGGLLAAAARPGRRVGAFRAGHAADGPRPQAPEVEAPAGRGPPLEAPQAPEAPEGTTAQPAGVGAPALPGQGGEA